MLEYYVKQQVWITVRLYIGQMLVGYGLGWTAPIIPKFDNPKTSPLPNELTETETSLIGSILYVGTILGPYLTGYLCNAIGRKPCFILAGLVSLLSFLLLATANSLAMIYVGRVLCGLGTGIIFIVNLVYIGEISSTNIRGILLTSNAIFSTLGTLIVYAVGPYVTYPLVSYIAAAITAVYLLGVLFIPESPTYLILKDRKEAAGVVMEMLGRSKEYHAYQEMKVIVEKQSFLQEWKQILTIKSNRKALSITLTLGILQQGSGIIAVTFFATTIFQLAGSSIEPNIATIIIGVTQIFSSTLTPFFVERIGRRILLIFSTTVCTLSLATLGVYFYLDYINHPSVTKIQWLPLVTLIIFFLSYDFGFGVIPGTLIGEMFQSNVRSTGSTVSVTVAWLFGFGVATVFGYMISDLGSHVTFWIFSSMCALACIFGVFVVPETKGKTLIEIEEMLNK